MMFTVFDVIHRVHNYYEKNTILKANMDLNFGKIYDLTFKLMLFITQL